MKEKDATSRFIWRDNFDTRCSRNNLEVFEVELTDLFPSLVCIALGIGVILGYMVGYNVGKGDNDGSKSDS